jgi:hypothetical protein
MPTVKKDFDRYKIWYSSGHPYEAHIYCYKVKSYRGRIVFFKDNSVVPPNHMAFKKCPSIHYKLSQFNDIISILRYEKPLYLFLNLDNMVGLLSTEEYEPVGEEE